MSGLPKQDHAAREEIAVTTLTAPNGSNVEDVLLSRVNRHDSESPMASEESEEIVDPNHLSVCSASSNGINGSNDNFDASSSEDWDFVHTDGSNNGRPLYKNQRSYSSNSVNSAVSADNVTFMDLLDPGFTVKVSRQAFTKVKTRTKKITDKAKLQKDRLINKINEEDLLIMRSKLFKRINKLDQNLLKAVEASKTEKFFYAFALFQIFYAGILIGKYPNYFHLYYSALFVLLMPIRLYTYYKKDFQYFLADLCYYVNVLTMLYIWVFPHSKHLYVVCFSFTFGTLAFAVILWRNSLVLHSIEKITSLFIHIIPPVTMFVITHEIDPEFKAKRFSGAAKITSWSSWNGIIWTSIYYLIWQSAYHYFITYKSKDEIKKGRVNSFSWLRKSFAKKPIGMFVNSLPEPFPVVAFTLIQYGYQLSTMLLCPLWMRYKRLASLFMALIFIVASYNGATFYLEVFGKKLEKEVIKLRNEISQLQAENILNTSLSNNSSNSVNIFGEEDTKHEDDSGRSNSPETPRSHEGEAIAITTATTAATTVPETKKQI